MGGCMSICRNRNPDLEEEPVKQVDVRAPSNVTTGSNASHPSIMRRTKKNKTRVTKNVMFNLEEEEIIYPNKGKEKTLIQFEQFSDDKIDIEKFEDKINNSEPKYEDEKEDQREKEIDQKVEIINKYLQDFPSKKEEKENETELLQDKIVDRKHSLTEAKIDNVEEKKEEEETTIKINDNNDDNNKDGQIEENKLL